jgi:hypothetical protein
MYSTAALMLANSHIGDLMADASLERRANLLRAARARHAPPRNHRVGRVNPVTRIVRILRATPRVAAP